MRLWPTPLLPLLLAALIVTCAVLPGDGHGTETCVGCRQSRSVSVSWGLSSRGAVETSAASTWILEQAPDHEHRFVRTGGWFSGGSVATLPSPMSCSLDDWVAFLATREPAEISRYVSRSLDPGDTRFTEEIERWLRGTGGASHHR